ncbi:MAG: hypothetical protein IKE52_02530 [Mogibacterium sp.]|nr:hypothetical protein [Mogibacterium sp.]
MTKQDLKRDIAQMTGSSMPSISEIARYLGVGRDTARGLVDGLDYYSAGRAKKYFAGDVAERILQQRGN